MADYYPESPRPDVLDDTETSTRESLVPLFWVIMHNDPVTTMDFVVMILMQVFAMEYDRSVEVMYKIHSVGLEHIELMPLERAEFKVERVHQMARAQGFPLTCTIEPE